MTDEEHEKLVIALGLFSDIFEKGTLTGGDGTIPYDPQPIKINEPYPQCPNCPWKNPGDWTWRPWQAPWYGPGDPISPNDWKIGDGEWWKHQPYCTSTTEDNPDAVKQTKTTGDCNCNSACNCQEK